MRSFVFGKRTAAELLRDPLSLGFGLGFPAVLLLLLTLIQSNIPVPLFAPEQLVPGIAVFGLSFLCLFSAMLVARDQNTSFLFRLQASPMRACDFILGYLWPQLPLALGQLLFCYAVGVLLGLPCSARILLSILLQFPLAIFQLSLGLLLGCLLTERQAGGICGALITNLSAWLSGAWFDLALVGGAFERIAKLLPFANATELGRMALSGNLTGCLGKLFLLLGYAVLALVAAVFVLHSRVVRKK